MKVPVASATKRLEEHASLIGALTVTVVVIALYARSMTFGFFGDDPSGYFRWMEGVSWPEMFTSSPGFFLRPLVFVISKLLWLAQGGYGAAGFHGVPLALHLANALLVGLLATSLARRRLYGWLAALLFATFPLSQEAVSEFDAFCHPLMVFWCLLALALFERALRSGGNRLLWAVYPCVILALLSHENGLIVPVLLLSLELLFHPPASRGDFVRLRALPYFVLDGLYLLWWLQIPKDPTSAPRTVAGILRNTLPFQQVAAYPLLPVAHLQVTNWPALAALVGLALLVTYIAARSLALRRLWLLAIIWMLLAAIPSVLFLDWDYLHGGPRLYYLASVGAALLWAAPPVALLNVRSTGAARVAAAAAGGLLALALVLPPVPFINCQMDLVAQATQLVRQVGAAAAAAPAGRDPVFVNLPAFFIANAEHPNGCGDSYPFVTTGVGVFPQYGHLQDFVRVNGGPDRAARGAVVAEYDANWPPRYGEVLSLHDIRDTLRRSQVYVFDISTWSLRDLSRLWQPGVPATGQPLAKFGGVMALRAVTVEPDGNNLVVKLLWQAQAAPVAPLTAFAHIYDGEGKLIAQHDGLPGQNGSARSYAPLALLQTGDQIEDVHAIPLKAPLPAGGYTIAVGLYDPATTKRLPARGEDGTALRDDLYVLTR